MSLSLSSHFNDTDPIKKKPPTHLKTLTNTHIHEDNASEIYTELAKLMG